jgi:putative membrane protein insertion efficiency factor
MACFTHSNPIRTFVGRTFAIFSRLVNAIVGGGVACRFHPTCSQYGREAVERFGVIKGGWLAAGRVLRCRPGAEWGYDPVPRNFDFTASLGSKR